MDAPATTESLRCPKCGSDQIDTDKFGSLRGGKPVLFFAFAVCFLAATIVALAVAQSLANSGLGHFVLLCGVGLAVVAYVSGYVYLEGQADVLSGVTKLLHSAKSNQAIVDELYWTALTRAPNG